MKEEKFSNDAAQWSGLLAQGVPDDPDRRPNEENSAAVPWIAQSSVLLQAMPYIAMVVVGGGWVAIVMIMSDCCDTGAGRNENIKGCALPGYPGCTLAHHNHSVNVLIFLYLDSETSNEISFASRRWSPPIRDFSIIQNSTHWGPATSPQVQPQDPFKVSF